MPTLTGARRTHAAAIITRKHTNSFNWCANKYRVGSYNWEYHVPALLYFRVVGVFLFFFYLFAGNVMQMLS